MSHAAGNLRYEARWQDLKDHFKSVGDRNPHQWVDKPSCLAYLQRGEFYGLKSGTPRCEDPLGVMDAGGPVPVNLWKLSRLR